jgi:hypothetical protein
VRVAGLDAHVEAGAVVERLVHDDVRVAAAQRREPVGAQRGIEQIGRDHHARNQPTAKAVAARDLVAVDLIFGIRDGVIGDRCKRLGLQAGCVHGWCQDAR